MTFAVGDPGHTIEHNRLTGVVTDAGVVVPDGSASAPSLTNTGDTNTGVFFPAADAVGVATAGTERVRIDSSGNVGIGTTSPKEALHLGSGRDILQGQNTLLGHNLYYEGGWKYAENGYGGALVLAGGSGQVAIYTAPNNTGGADAAASEIERLKIDSAGLITGSGTSLGAWTAYTPTLGGTGWAIGNGTTSGYYCQIGKVVHYAALVTFGSSSTFGSGALTITLPPITRSTRTNVNLLGNAWLHDASTGKVYAGLGDIYSGATDVLVRSIVSGTPGETTSVISSAPFTWANLDRIVISGTYEAA